MWTTFCVDWEKPLTIFTRIRFELGTTLEAPSYMTFYRLTAENILDSIPWQIGVQLTAHPLPFTRSASPIIQSAYQRDALIYPLRFLLPTTVHNAGRHSNQKALLLHIPGKPMAQMCLQKLSFSWMSVPVK
jgi:hypothetical protein